MEHQRTVDVNSAGGRLGEPFVYTVREAAARLKVSPGTVRNMIEEGQLYAIRLHVRRIVVPGWALHDLVARPMGGDISERRR